MNVYITNNSNANNNEIKIKYDELMKEKEKLIEENNKYKMKYKKKIKKLIIIRMKKKKI